MTVFNIYCDESRHTSDKGDRYAVIGALQCPRDEKIALVHRIHSLQALHNAHGELGWKRLSPNRAKFYDELLDIFLSTPFLNFRCLVVDLHDSGWSRKRLRRILWIKEVLNLTAGTVQRYAQTRKTDRGRQAKRRTLVVVEESYVVVFDNPNEKGKPHQFVTAFPADHTYMEHIKRTSFLAETRVGTKKAED